MKSTGWDLVCVHLLIVKCLHLQHYAFEIPPDHASGEGPVVWYF